MRDYTDPQGTAELEQYKLASAIAEFQARTISDDVFRALLVCRGFHGRRLSDEFAYQDSVRHGKQTAVTP